MRDIIAKFIQKQIQIKIHYIFYTGDIIKEELTVDEIINSDDKKRIILFNSTMKRK